MSKLAEPASIDLNGLSEGERKELLALGMITKEGDVKSYVPPANSENRYVPVERHAISAPSVLNEAYNYARPSSFSRGLRVDLGTHTLLLISGTASVDEEGKTAHVGDFRAQCWRTYRNIAELLASEGATWQDVVRTTCYLRDIERDYRDFNAIRTMFFRWLGLDPLPASTGVQARICREDLLIEIEAMAVLRNRNGG